MSWADGGWDYPPGVTGNEPELSGEWPCTDCGRTTNGDHGCDCGDAHCESCCPHTDTEDEEPCQADT